MGAPKEGFLVLVEATAVAIATENGRKVSIQSNEGFGEGSEQ